MEERKLLIVQPDSLPLQVSHVTACGSPQTRVQPNKGRQLMNNKTLGDPYCPTRTGYYSCLMTFFTAVLRQPAMCRETGCDDEEGFNNAVV